MLEKLNAAKASDTELRNSLVTEPSVAPPERVTVKDVLDFMNKLLNVNGLVYNGRLEDLPEFAQACHERLDHDKINGFALEGENEEEVAEFAWSAAKEQLREMGIIDHPVPRHTPRG